MMNLLSVDKGDVYLFGQQITPAYSSFKRRIGLVLSKPFFIEDFSPKEYLNFVGAYQGLPKRDLTIRINELISFFNLEGSETKIRFLSSGNQMKVSISAALLHNPDVLIFDEPFVNLDFETSEKIKSLIKVFSGKKTILLTSHNLDLITELCNEILVLDKGAILLKKDIGSKETLEQVKSEITGVLLKENQSISKMTWLR